MQTYFLKLDPRAIIPEYATEKSSGFDLHAIEDILIPPGGTRLIKTGLAVLLPVDTELQIRPKSGLSLKGPIRIANSPGTIDEDYLNKDIGIICDNVGEIPLRICEGDKVAQGVVCPVLRPKIVKLSLIEYNLIAETRRTSRDGGFGSTN
tara:strand:- start:9295 stop:9744 length:450 start_codon:yes stop_codon:yes gene_type:complete